MLVQSPGEDAGPQTGAAERVGSPVRVSISFVPRVMVRVVRAKLKPRGGSLPAGDLSRGGAGRRHRFPGSIHNLCAVGRAERHLDLGSGQKGK